MWDISRIGQYGILLLGISSEASRRRGMEKVNSFREPVGAAGFCAIWQRNGEAGIRKKQHNCKLRFSERRSMWIPFELGQTVYVVVDNGYNTEHTIPYMTGMTTWGRLFTERQCIIPYCKLSREGLIYRCLPIMGLMAYMQPVKRQKHI